MTVRKSVKKPTRHGKVKVKRKASAAPVPSPEFSDGDAADSTSAEGSTEAKPAPKAATAKKRSAKSAAKPAAKKTAAKKSAAKKPSAKKSATKTARKKGSDAVAKAAEKKAATPTPKKKAAKKRTAAAAKNVPDGDGPAGYRAGSNSAIAVEEMLAGGADRAEVGRRITKRCGPTRKGHPVNASGMISSLLLELQDRGYVVESHWVLKEPTPQSKAAATRRKKQREKAA